MTMRIILSGTTITARGWDRGYDGDSRIDKAIRESTTVRRGSGYQRLLEVDIEVAKLIVQDLLDNAEIYRREDPTWSSAMEFDANRIRRQL